MTSPTAPLPPERGRYQQQPGGYPQQQGSNSSRQASPRSSRPTVDAATLWAGGAATAVVTGLIGLVGVLIFRWGFNIPILAPKQDGAYGDVHTTTLVLVAAGGALVATLLLHLLLLGVPRPLVFFGWIVALVTAVFVIFPFRTGAPLDQKFATAAVYAVIGIATGTLLGTVAGRATRTRSAGPPPPPDYA